MPASSAPLGGFGSPARQPVPAYAPAPPPSPLQAAVPAPPAAPLVAGSFSPSDASSIESAAEADELLLLGGLAGLVGMPAAAPLGQGLPSPGAKHSGPPTAGAPAADADGIDDVLRLQPWLTND